MRDDDAALIDPEASATGILHCLRMLADEAAGLRLAGTLQALHDAIAVCQQEFTSDRVGQDGSLAFSAGSRYH